MTGDGLAEQRCRIQVHITPRSGRDTIDGWDGAVLRARVVAPPVDDRANRALEALLGSALGLPKSRIQVTQGTQSRRKLVEVRGMDEAAVRAALVSATRPS